MLKQHPKALRILIPTELAETYGYFTLQAILVFYLIQALGFSDAHAYAFSGQFIALAYIMPLVGGWFADHLLGGRRAIWLGGCCLCSGYALLALRHQTLLFGLSLVIIGNGLLKPNISSFIGEFYGKHDPRREAGFTLVYTGVSIGSLVGIASAGYVQKYWGWSACFAAASFALFLGMSVFRWGFHYFQDKGLSPDLQAKRLKTICRSKCSLLLWLGLIFVLIFYAMKGMSFGNNTVYGFGLLFCVYIGKITWGLDAKGRRAVLGLMILFIIAIFYKAMFFETYLSVSVFTDRLVDRSLFGHEIPAATFLSLSSFFTIALGPFFARMWQSNKIKFSITFKFALSMLVVGGAMQVLAVWISLSSSGVLPIVSIVIFRFFFAISELFILPLGLAVVSEYAPKDCVGLMMGGWFITAAFGGKLAGILACIASIPQGMTDMVQMKMIYQAAFQDYALLNFIVFIVCLMLIPMMNRLLCHQESYA